MTEITYYRWAAALPIALPIIAYPIAWHITRASGVLDSAPVLIVLSGLAGGPAYIPFICALMWWLRGKTIASYRYASVVAPLVFAAVFVLYLSVLGYFLPSPEPFFDNVLFYLRYVLGVGFGYVVLVHVLRWALSCCGWLHDREIAV